MDHRIEDFYGVYLLVNENPKFKGRTYIGYTVDPNRRIRQHNRGAHAGGAWRTSGRGPWEMVLIVHGFPNEISALRFEWAWQKPEKSRRLKNLPKKGRKESAFMYRVRIVSEMLNTGPWHRLPLTVRWLKQEYRVDFPPTRSPPLHMPIMYGPVEPIPLKKSRKAQERQTEGSSSAEDVESTGTTESEKKSSNKDSDICYLCQKEMMEDDSMSCLAAACSMASHILCLAARFLQDEPDEFVPIEGQCPKCHLNVLWGDLVRHRKGCYQTPTTQLPVRDVSTGS